MPEVNFDFSLPVLVGVEEMFRQLLDARHHRPIPQMLTDIRESVHVGPHAERPYDQLS